MKIKVSVLLFNSLQYVTLPGQQSYPGRKAGGCFNDWYSNTFHSYRRLCVSFIRVYRYLHMRMWLYITISPLTISEVQIKTYPRTLFWASQLGAVHFMKSCLFMINMNMNHSTHIMVLPNCFLPSAEAVGFFGRKIHNMPFFGGKVKTSVPCRRFAACKRTLWSTWESESQAKLTGHFSPVIPSFTNRGLSCRLTWHASGDDGWN
jgi:hypothetical protein